MELSFELTGCARKTSARAEHDHGVRVRLDAAIAGARIPLQIDVGFGDSVTPAAGST